MKIEGFAEGESGMRFVAQRKPVGDLVGRDGWECGRKTRALKVQLSHTHQHDRKPESFGFGKFATSFNCQNGRDGERKRE